MYILTSLFFQPHNHFLVDANELNVAIKSCSEKFEKNLTMVMEYSQS